VYSSRIKQLFVYHLLLRLELRHGVLNGEEIHPKERVFVNLLRCGLLLLLEHVLVLDVLEQKLLLIHLLVILFLF